MLNRRTRLAVTFVVLGGVLIAGSAAAQSSSNVRGSVKELVGIRLTWKYKGEDAPIFVAIEKGYYADEGLDVQAAEGSGAESVVRLIANGTEKIGFGPATAVAEAVSNGLPLEVIAVYQPAVPIGMVSFPGVSLQTPKDLEGKKLGLTTNETFANLIGPFLNLNHVDPDKVTRVMLANSVLNTLFMARKLDVMSVYLNVEVPLIEKRSGVIFNKMAIADFGMKLLGDSFFVNKDYANPHGDVLRRLLAATARGYVEARRDPATAAQMLATHMIVGDDPDILEAQLKATLAAVPVPTEKPYGWQDRALWQSNLDILKNAGVIKTIYDVDRYYTNEYLDNSPQSRN